MISLKLPACTHLGEGSVKTVPEIIRRENAKKVVVFTDQGVRQSGVCDVLLRELTDVPMRCWTIYRGSPATWT